MERRTGHGSGADPTGMDGKAATRGGEPAADQVGDVELLEDRTLRITGGRAGRRLGLSLPGAIAGSFLVTALAFGAALGPMNLFGGAGHDGRDDTAQADDPKPSDDADELNELNESAKPVDEDGKDDETANEPPKSAEPEPSEKPEPVVEPSKEPEPEPTKATEPEPTVKPTPKPTPKPTEKPDGAKVALEVVIKEGHPVGGWSSCDGLDFAYYKVIRSTDETVTWPMGDDDTMVTAVGPDGERKFWDGEAPHGAKAFYRVFCVRSTEQGYVVVVSSAVVAIGVPAEEIVPTPEPTAMGFDVELTEAGVVLHWEACGAENFTYYKVVRSTTTENPSYFPWTDGTELIGVIENSSVTGYTDASIESGMTISYRVQSIGYWNGGKVLLGETAVITVTIP